MIDMIFQDLKFQDLKFLGANEKTDINILLFD